MQVFIIFFDNRTVCTLTAPHVQVHFCKAVVRSELMEANVCVLLNVHS